MSYEYVPDRGHVVWMSLDPQAGNEQAKRRPVLVLSPAGYNGRGLRLALVCPVTDGAKGYPFQIPLTGVEGVRGVVQSDQVKSVDWVERRADYIGRVDEAVVLEVIGRLLALLDPEGSFTGDADTSDV